MFRLYDFQCWECGLVIEAVHTFPSDQSPVRGKALWCESCQVNTLHERLISRPAPYLGEKLFTVPVYGGRFDTAGAKRPPKKPDLLPAHATASDYRDRYHSKEWKEWRKEHDSVRAENKIKQNRMSAIKKDPTIDMRHYKVPGDPKL